MGRGFGNPLWAKAPFVLRRYPGLLVGIAAGALLLALAAAASPLYLSAAASSSLKEAIGTADRFSTGIEIVRTDGIHPIDLATGRDRPGFSYVPRQRLLREATASIPNLGPEVFTLLGPRISVSKPGRSTQLDVRLLARTGAVDHVKRVAGREGPGVWLASGVAKQLGIRPGDQLELHSAIGRRDVQVPVDGLYQSLLGRPETPFWSSLRPQIGQPSDPVAQPTFLLGDRDQVARLSTALGEPTAEFIWEFPLAANASLTVPSATALAHDFTELQNELQRPDSALARVFRCTRCAFTGRQVGFASDLPTSIGVATQTVDAERGPIDLIAVAGSLVALGVLGAAGAFAIARRRVEASLLYARGASAWTMAGKTALESLLPVLAGAAAGLGVAYLVAVAFGPNGPIDPRAVGEAARSAAVRIPIALVLLAGVAALMFVRQSGASPSSVRRRLGRIPWEVVALGLAGFFLGRLLAGKALSGGTNGGVTQPSVDLLLFPICFIAGCGGLAARALRLPLRRLHARSDRLRSAAGYLAVVRLAGAERLAVLLVTACALALGIFIYAQTVVASYSDNVKARSHLFLGSDVQGAIGPEEIGPRRFPFPITRVTVVYQGGSLPDGALFDLLAIDSRTFASVAYWQNDYAGTPLRELVARLRRSRGKAVPVIVVGDESPARTLRTDQATIPIDVVGTARAFPGMSFQRPLVVADAKLLRHAFSTAGGGDPLLDPSVFAQLWVKGPDGPAARALAATSVQPDPILTAGQVLKQPDFTAFTRTFAFMKSLGFGAGFLAVVAILLYLQTRQRNRVVSFALSRRMGLGAGEHRLALVLELGGMLLAAFVIAVVLALVAARLLFARIEPLASLSPVLLFDVPFALILGALLALVAVSLAGGLLANRTAEHANLAEVMRLEA